MDQNRQIISERKIRNRVSADEQMAENIEAAVGIFRFLDLEYAVFGSCGIQTYFDCFFQLPNDLDVIVRRGDVDKLRSYCAENGHEFVEEVGRSKIFINAFPVQIIPEWFTALDKSIDAVFGRIDLSGFISDSVTNYVKLVSASSTPKINVLPVEMCLFLDLIRTIYTNSLMRVYFVFRHLEIDHKKFGSIIENNSVFTATILQRLDGYILKLNAISHFSKDDILIAQSKIAELRRHIGGA